MGHTEQTLVVLVPSLYEGHDLVSCHFRELSPPSSKHQKFPWSYLDRKDSGCLESVRLGPSTGLQ